jgi:hypothetical protein
MQNLLLVVKYNCHTAISSTSSAIFLIKIRYILNNAQGKHHIA